MTVQSGLPPPAHSVEGLPRRGLYPCSHGWMEEGKQNEASISAGHGICESGLSPAGESRKLATGRPGFPPWVRSGVLPWRFISEAVLSAGPQAGLSAVPRSSGLPEPPAVSLAQHNCALSGPGKLIPSCDCQTSQPLQKWAADGQGHGSSPGSALWLHSDWRPAPCGQSLSGIWLPWWPAHGWQRDGLERRPVSAGCALRSS